MPQHKALLLPTKRGEFVVGTVETVKPGPGDVLVKIEAAALNPVDWKIQKREKFVTEYPAIVGSDSAGVIEEVGESVTSFKKGDRVIHQSRFTKSTATFQQYAIVPAEIVAKIPENISFEQAASLPLGLATATVGYYSAPDKTGLGLTPPWEAGGEGKYRGQGIVIFGGASSVGQYAIQLAHLSGFSPIVVTASLHNTDLVKSLGATHIIDRNADVVAEAHKILKDPPSIIYDAISFPNTQEQAWKILAPNGRLVLVLPCSPSLKNGEDGKKAMSVIGNFHAHGDLGRSLYSKLMYLLKSEKIKVCNVFEFGVGADSDFTKPNRVEVLPSGLEGIIDGLKRMEENKVSGLKLIAKPQETA